MLDLRILVLSAVLALGACSQNDNNITRSVEERIAVLHVDPNQVKVWTERRIVHLEGVVNDTDQRNKLEVVARNVPGVLAVDNRLTVTNPVHTTGGKPGEPVEPEGPESPTPR